MSEPEKYLEIAEEALADARLDELSKRSSWSNLHYSAFYSAKAALISMGKEPGTHRGTDNLVGKILYKQENLIKSETASFYSNLRRIREEIEYEPHAVIHEDLENNIREVKNFIQKMEKVVRSNE